MPLSEHEQRQLEQIEQALYADYPRFANAVRATDPRVHYKRRVVYAALGFLLGVGLLLAGVVIKVIPLGVAGFVVMLACSMWAVTSYRHMAGIATGRVPAKERRAGKERRGSHEQRPAKEQRPPKEQRPAKERRPGKQSGMMERLEERWRRRQERDGG